jgi:hypothetical protein
MNNTNRKHNKYHHTYHSDTTFCLTKRPQNRPLGVRSFQTPGNLLDSFNLTVATVNVHHG